MNMGVTGDRGDSLDKAAVARERVSRNLCTGTSVLEHARRAGTPCPGPAWRLVLWTVGQWPAARARWLLHCCSQEDQGGHTEGLAGKEAERKLPSPACSNFLTGKGRERLQEKSHFEVVFARERFHSGWDLKTGETKRVFCRVSVGVRGFQQGPRSRGLRFSPWPLSG